jgi:glycosyltransferase involved in cell wall biosynthesis
MISTKLTEVIPCKNEGNTIYACLLAISNQVNSQDLSIIIADSSDNQESLDILAKCKSDFSNLNIQIIKGGFPAKARLEGSKLVKTEYLLFLDADIMLTDRETLTQAIVYCCANPHIDLVTIPFYTDPKWNWVFRAFEFFQKIGPTFAIGGFQLWKTSAYWRVGGYDPSEIFAEDYSISSKVNRSNFKMLRSSFAYTSPRRFENKGIFYMFKLMILSYFNRNNPEFFKKHHNYWT